VDISIYFFVASCTFKICTLTGGARQISQAFVNTSIKAVKNVCIYWRIRIKPVAKERYRQAGYRASYLRRRKQVKPRKIADFYASISNYYGYSAVMLFVRI
jgi:hypothetical protein